MKETPTTPNKTPARTGLRRAATAAALVVMAAAFAACTGGKPSYYRGSAYELTDSATVAILPLVSFSQYEKAPDVVMNALVVQVLSADRFFLVDPGEVERVVVENRLRLTDRLALDTIRAIGGELGAEYLLMGTINEFDFVREGSNTVPSVSLTLRMLSVSDGRIVWAATHSKRGDDTESVFGLGRIGTLEKLTEETVEDMTDSMRIKKK
jgi:TolB-like protein